MIKTELRKAIREKLWVTCSNPPIEKFIKPKDLGLKICGIESLITALLPIIAKQAVSLVEVDEKKVEQIIKLARGTFEDFRIEWLNSDDRSKLPDLNLDSHIAHTLTTSQIIKGKE